MRPPGSSSALKLLKCADPIFDVVAVGKLVAADGENVDRHGVEATQEEDQLLRYVHGDRVSVISFDEREGEIDSRGDARGRPETAIMDEDALVDDRGCRISRAQLVEVMLTLEATEVWFARSRA